NLTLNAMRYTPRGGTVLLRALRQTDGAGTSHALLQVVDTGVGIAAGDLPHIFERSFRGEGSRRRERELEEGAVGGAMRSGSGLGLAIAREIVEMHDGRIWAVSPLPRDLEVVVRQRLAQGALTHGDELGEGTAIIWTLPMTGPRVGHETTAIAAG